MMKRVNRLWTTTILLGLAFDILFWKKTPGISFAVFVTLVLSSGVFLLLSEGFRPAWRSLWLLAPIAFFAAMTFIRTEPMSTFLNYVLTLTFMAVFALSYRGGRWLSYSISDYVAGFFKLGYSGLVRPLELIIETRKQREEREEEQKDNQFWPVLRGILIALPIVAVFTALLVSADLIFAQRIEAFIDLFRLENLPEFIFRGIYIFVIGYVLVGMLLHAAHKSEDEKLIGEEKPLIAPFLGFTETSIVLGSVIVLFALFVAVQFQYFFGGQANINLEGYTYAEYARRGFGELVVVAFFSLLLLLGLSYITRRPAKRQRNTFTGLVITLVLLVLVMLVSAFRRLMLYEAAYGFTRMRIYPHVYMIWLGALLVGVALLEVLQRQRAVALAIVFVSVGFAATLNLLNVDAFIVRQNVARLADVDEELDVAYLASLSDDAVPAMAAAFKDESLATLTHEGVGAALFCHRYINEDRLDEARPWQSFHLARRRAARIYVRLGDRLDGYTILEEDWPLTIISASGSKFVCQESFVWD
jgi:hypothetical protein